jgi:hypothetical protein
VFARIAATIALRSVLAGALGEFSGTQFALEQRGAETAIHKIRALVDQGASVLAVDFSNAFNTISRRAVAEELRKRAWASPTLPLFDLLYCDASSLVWRGGEISSTEGVRQGCVLGPLLFCVGIAEALRKIRLQFPAVGVFAFMDDISLVSSDPSALNGAYALLAAEAAKAGLLVNKEKTQCHGPLSPHIQNAKTAALGVKILGAWIASPGLEVETQKHLRKRRLENDPLFSAIPLLNAESAFAVLRFCAHPIWNYATRVHPDTVAQSALFDQSVRETLCKIAGASVEELTADHLDLIKLPLSKGGGGLRTYETICAENFAASKDATGDDQEARTAKHDEAVLQRVARGPFEEQRCAQAKRHASAWLEGPAPEFVFPSSDFAAALRHRLCLHEPWGNKTSRVCACGLSFPRRQPSRTTFLAARGATERAFPQGTPHSSSSSRKRAARPL